MQAVYIVHRCIRKRPGDKQRDKAAAMCWHHY